MNTGKNYEEENVVKDMLIQLCSADGVTGFEGHAAQKAAELLAPYCDRV